MNVLVIAPHPDDEIIGVGGTIAKRVREGANVFVCIVTKGQEAMFDRRFIEQGREECRKADSLLGVKKTLFLDFPAVMLETVPRAELNGKMIEIIQKLKPEEVYLPHRGDMQIDHQLVVDSAMVALRPKYPHVVKRVYAYETLSETGWNIPNVVNEFIPNVYENISYEMELKMKALNVFQSQLSKFPAARSLEAVEALGKFRGATVNVDVAEAFSLIRQIN